MKSNIIKTAIWLSLIILAPLLANEIIGTWAIEAVLEDTVSGVIKFLLWGILYLILLIASPLFAVFFYISQLFGVHENLDFERYDNLKEVLHDLVPLQPFENSLKDWDAYHNLIKLIRKKDK